MPHFDVLVTRDTSESTTIRVEVQHQHEAIDAALRRARADFTLDWSPDDNMGGLPYLGDPHEAVQPVGECEAEGCAKLAECGGILCPDHADAREFESKNNCCGCGQPIGDDHADGCDEAAMTDQPPIEQQAEANAALQPFEEDWTPEQREMIDDLSGVSEGIADWAREQLRGGFTVEQVWDRIRSASASRYSKGA